MEQEGKWGKSSNGSGSVQVGGGAGTPGGAHRHLGVRAAPSTQVTYLRLHCMHIHLLYKVKGF